MPININGSGTITGITAGGLPDNSITTNDIADDAVTTAKIPDNAVTTDKIPDSAVTDAKIVALTSSKLSGALPAIDGSALTGISSIGTIVKIAADEITGTATGSGGFSNTGLEVTITPAATANKILLFTTGVIGTDKNTVAVRFTENNAAVGIGDPSGSRTRTSFKIRGPSDNNHSSLFAGSCILSPNSTSALTYRVQMYAESNGTWFIGRSKNDNNDSNAPHSRASTYLYAIELLGANTTIST